MSLVLADDQAVSGLGDVLAELPQERLKTIEEIAELAGPGTFFGVVEGDEQAKQDLDRAVALMDAEVRVELAKAGYAPEGSIEAKAKAVDLYLRAAYEQEVLPYRVSTKIAVLNAERTEAFARAAQAQTAVELENVQRQYRVQAAGTLARVEADRALAVARTADADFAVSDFAADRRLDEVDRQRRGYEATRPILDQAAAKKLLADAIVADRRSSRALRKAKYSPFIGRDS